MLHVCPWLQLYYHLILSISASVVLTSFGLDVNLLNTDGLRGAVPRGSRARIHGVEGSKRTAEHGLNAFADKLHDPRPKSRLGKVSSSKLLSGSRTGLGR